MVTSKPGLSNLRYGYIESRVKFPKGSGFWPSFFAWPTVFATPEIDAMEFFGDNPARAYLVYHRQAGGPAPQKVLLNSDWTRTWHTIGVDWRPTGLTWYVDGVKRWNVVDTTDRDMYLVASLAIADGRVAPAPNRLTRFPSSYLIDYIRVFQRQ
jgi:beta-glucanase (GH16 family)